ncbi:MAG: PqqD family protein [Oligoflexia bacterium]|nr:PqqD family protein [Oligoflexia bacterium]
MGQLEGLKFQKAKNIHWKSVNGEAVLLHIGSGDYYALDKVGTFLWGQMAERSTAITDLIDSLVMEYDCNRDQAMRDAKEFCGSLLAERLLETTEE